MPDSTKSGRFPAPYHKEEKQDNWYVSAETYIEGLRRTNEQLPNISYPELEEQIEEVEQDPMDEEEADEENEATTEVQERAAEVETDTAHAEPNTTEEPKPQQFVPKMPELEFSVIRHLFQGSRHWCVKGKHVMGKRIICSMGDNENYNENMFGPVTTHNDNMCLECLQVAKEKYKVKDPERFVHGEEVTTADAPDPTSDECLS